jgi:hypothetical protein
MTTILKEDLIFYKNEGGAIMSGGYNVESHMLQNGISPMKTLNLDQHGGKDNKVSSSFENMAVPAGLYYITQPNHKKKEQMNYKKEHVALSDDIFDKLYEMIEYDDKKKRKTRKHISKNIEMSPKKNKKTKRVK